MTDEQFDKFLTIRLGYKTDPRWVVAQATLQDPSASEDELEWARQRMFELELSCERDAHRARIMGL